MHEMHEMSTSDFAPDPDLLQAARRFHRIRWAAVAALAAIVAAAIAIGADILASQDNQLRRDETRLLSSCDFYRPLTPLPVTVNPATGKPTALSVSIIAGAREAYVGQGCGRIPPAAPSVIKWAAYYHIRMP